MNSGPFDNIGDPNCPEEHMPLEGPCVDVGQCHHCWMPIGVLRPSGETFGFHARDCSLPERHYGQCVGGGEGHKPMHIRGYWSGFEADVAAERQWWEDKQGSRND